MFFVSYIKLSLFPASPRTSKQLCSISVCICWLHSLHRWFSADDNNIPKLLVSRFSTLNLIHYLLPQDIFVFSQLRSVQINQIHINLCISLLLMYVMFLVGVERRDSKIGCVTTAAFLHYFILVSWCWMCIESFTMHK